MTKLTKRRNRNTGPNGIKGFAESYRLKTSVDPEDGTQVIQGQFGQLYEVDDNSLGVMVMPGTSRKQHWTRSRAKFLEAGFSILQDGDHEGSASFCPDNPAQAKLAIKIVGAKRKRTASPAQREQLLKARQALRREQFLALETTNTPSDNPEHREIVSEAQTANLCESPPG